MDFIEIIVVPVIKDKPKIIKIIKKKTVVIECVVVSKFAPKCTWFKEKNEVAEGKRHKVEVKQLKEGEFAVQLEITEVNNEDKGSYQMVAKNEKGEAISQTVELIDIPEPEDDEKPPVPEIRKRLRDETIEETRSLELNVELKKTLKKTKVIWYDIQSVFSTFHIYINMYFDNLGTKIRLLSRSQSTLGSHLMAKQPPFAFQGARETNTLAHTSVLLKMTAVWMSARQL